MQGVSFFNWKVVYQVLHLHEAEPILISQNHRITE